MTTTNQTFDWSRFTATLRKELAENGRTILLALLAFYLYFTFQAIIENWASRGTCYISMDPAFVFIFMAVIVSLGFSGLRTKKSRTNYLCTSSSTVEKFAANTLIYAIGSVVAIIACVYLADFTRIAVLSFWKSDTFVVQGPIAFSNTVIRWVKPGSTFAASFPQWLSHCYILVSAYVLGTIIWPRNSFLKTSIAFLVYLCATCILFSLDTISKGVILQTEETMNYLRYFNCFMATLCWIASWYLLKKKNVISRKWWK